MKRSLCISLLCLGLALFAIPLAWMRVNGEKEDVSISEEVLSGDPAAARDVTLRIASQWNRRLLWDTEYDVGSGSGARSEFSFSAEPVECERRERKSAWANFRYGALFGTCVTEEDFPVDVLNMQYPEILRAVAERTQKGQAHEETVRIADYYEYYPIDFEIMGYSVEFEGDNEEALAYLAELFRIPAAEDRIKIRVDRNADGDFISCEGERIQDNGNAVIVSASAFGEAGCYYAFCLEDARTGERAHRGEDCGLFYLPFVEEDGWIQVDLTQMRRVCSLPQDTVPEGMLLDEGKGWLYVTVKGEDDYSLLVYDLDHGTPNLAQRVELGQERVFQAKEAAERRVPLADTDVELELASPWLCTMSREDGGLLLTWSDNGFSFVTETDGECQLWCSGQFPEQPEEEYVGTGQGWTRNHMFPVRRECLFDGERLVLAAFEDWDSLNVLLAVYGREGEAYSGYYRYDTGDYFPQEGYMEDIRPQGWSRYAFLEERHLMDMYVRDTGELVKPLELLGR